MKILKAILRFSSVALCCGLVVLACNSDELEVAPATENPADPAVVAALDGIADRLRFFGATKIQGNAPAAPSASSLKFSLKDTLYLVPGVKMPIKFLHIGATQNVAGVYVQVYNASTGAQYYFDVPEHPTMEESDTISVVLVGFENDSTGLGPFGGGAPPASWTGGEDDFEIEITPYDDDGQLIDKVKVPVEVDEPNNDTDSPTAPDPSEFLNESGEWWEWSQTLTYNRSTNEETQFESAPDVILGGNQIIKGCCIDGFSEYGVGFGCADSPLERELLFLTYVQFNYESINFRYDGTFARITLKTTSDPDPWNSNFCDDGNPGVVILDKTQASSLGNWSISKGVVPQNASYLFQDPSDVTYLTTRTTSQSKPNGGFGTVGGIIWDVNSKFLMLLKPDSEGGDQHLMIIYERKLPTDEDWYAL
jgi:hypothetical protein